MRATTRGTLIGIVVVCLALAAIFVLVPAGHKPPPLPFDESVYQSTKLSTFGLPANPTIRDRINVFLMRWQQNKRFKNPQPTVYTFGPSPVMPCSVQGLLNQCMEVTGTRYFMPLGVAASAVQFGHTNTLNGSQWVAAFENTLTNQPVNCFDTNTHRTVPQQLVLIRFPESRAALLLPQNEANEFLRTNSALKAKQQ